MTNFQSLIEINPLPSTESCGSWSGHKSGVVNWVGLRLALAVTEGIRDQKGDFPLGCITHEPRDRRPPPSFRLRTPPQEHPSSNEALNEAVRVRILKPLSVSPSHTHPLHLLMLVLQIQIPHLTDAWKK